MLNVRPAMRSRNKGLRTAALSALFAGLAATHMARAETLSGAALVKALRHGGYVLVMRHASSPLAPPAAGDAEPDNAKRERQLDDAGKRTARDMGAAIRALQIPIGEVWSSPTYRALETVRLAGLPAARTVEALGDRGQSMQAASGAQAAWLRTAASQRPRAGTDMIVVTHSPNITAAFGQEASGLSDGEVLVFHPNGRTAAEPVGRIKIEEWPSLAAQR